MFCDVTEPKRSHPGEPLATAQGGAGGGRRGAQSVAAQEVVNSSLGNLHS